MEYEKVLANNGKLYIQTETSELKKCINPNYKPQHQIAWITERDDREKVSKCEDRTILTTQPKWQRESVFLKMERASETNRKITNILYSHRWRPKEEKKETLEKEKKKKKLTFELLMAENFPHLAQI